MDFLRDVASGAVGAWCCVYAGLPLDTIKIRMQLGADGQSLGSTYRSIVSQEGWRALFKGASPALASAMLENSVVFAANGMLTRLAEDYLVRSGDQRLRSSVESDFVATSQSTGTSGVTSLPWSTQLLIGGASGVFSSTAICAPEVVKCQLQMDMAPVTAASARRAIVKVYAAGGISGFARGLPALWMRDVPFYFAFFGAYTGLTRLYHHFSELGGSRDDDDDSVPLVICWLNGGLSGSLAWATVFPFDVVKSLQQTHSGTPSLANAVRMVYRGEGRLSTSIEGAGGIRAFYRGCLPAVLRGFPANGALLLGVESTTRLWNIAFGVDQ
eukprot:INCI6793.2.p1 GENE.INCI6793.2~~INCI6793.2.p1  ORF type:complete len:328 (+),score=45.43 INCI6793.2:225-1208(+)